MSEQREILNDCESIRAWATGQQIPKGTSTRSQLPSTLAHLTEDGSVEIAHTNDERFFILLKKKIGWKGNFEGVLYVDQGLKQSERIEPQSGGSYISLPGFGIFEELYIRKQNSDQLFDVYFDLN